MSQMNPEQQSVVDHLDGPVRVGAVAGSGKTTALIERVVKLIRKHQISARKILVISFSRAACDEVKRRMSKKLPGVDTNQSARTFHSLGLEIYKNECGGGYIDNSGILWLKAMNQAYRSLGLKSEKKALKAFASYVKNHMLDTHETLRRLGRTDPRMMEAAKMICDTVASKHPPHAILEAYYKAEEIRSNIGIQHRGERLTFVTFDDMIYQSAMALQRHEVRERWASRWDYILQDESQDENTAQASIAESLARSHRNYMVVGDPAQCHPPGVKIETAPGELESIENLSTGDTVRSWNRQAQKMVGGRRIEVSCRPYSGSLTSMHVLVDGSVRSVPMTPDHRVLCRWTDRTSNICVTYLMYREDRGFRVGWCKLFAKQHESLGFHLGARARLEKADRAWVLATHENRTDASVHESIVAMKYGIPTATFEQRDNIHQTDQAIRRIFTAYRDVDRSGERGRSCLEDHNRKFDLPLYPFPTDDEAKGVKYKRATYFKVYAANLLPQLMSVPIPDFRGKECWFPIASIGMSSYEGPVFSLDVEKDHSYAANGIVVLNCIYEWRGANPQKILAFDKEWPGAKTIMMNRNYRSGIEIVSLANRIVDCMPANTVITDDLGFTPDMISERATHSHVGYHRFATARAEAEAVSLNIAAHQQDGLTWKDQAILVRQNRMTLDVELALANREIPYKMLTTGASFFDLKETKLVLGYLRVMNDSATKDDFRQSLLFPTRGVSGAFSDKVSATQEQRDCDWLSAVRAELVGAPRGATEWLSVMESLQSLTSLAPGLIVQHLMEVLKLDDWFSSEGDAEADGGSSSSNLSSVRDMADRFETLDEMLDAIGRMEAHRKANVRKRDVVIISTVHRAKGREWPVVYLPQMGTGLFPTAKGDPAEERRCFYVACTRAMDELWISGPRHDVDGNAVGESYLAVEAGLDEQAFEAKRVVKDPEPIGTQIGLDL